MRAVTVAVLVLSMSAAARSQSPAPASFEVASVKRYQPVTGRRESDSISVMPGGRFTAPSATLRGLIAAAYGVLDIQIVDSGRILGNNRFEIEATTKADVTIDQARSMLRTLLADRFRLVAHRETRELPVYAMTVAREDRRLGEQLRQSGPECTPVRGPAGVPPPPPPPPGESVGRVLALSSMPLRCGSLVFSSTSGGHWSIREITMRQLADRLVGVLGRPVVDGTRLEGLFDLDLTYTPDNPVIDASNAPNAPSLLSAIREQLGLRLESTRVPIEVLVIDRVEAPTEN